MFDRHLICRNRVERIYEYRKNTYHLGGGCCRCCGSAVSVLGLHSETEREGGGAIDPLSKLEKVPRFPKLRRWAFAGMIFLPVLTIFGFVVAEYIERRHSNKIIVLVANFRDLTGRIPLHRQL